MLTVWRFDGETRAEPAGVDAGVPSASIECDQLTTQENGASFSPQDDDGGEGLSR